MLLGRRLVRLVGAGMAAATVVSLSAVPAGAASADTSWPMVGFDLQHTGSNPSESVLGPTNVGSLSQLWSTPVGAPGNQYPFVDTSPVVAAGVTVGGSSSDLLYAGNENGNLVAINAATGALVWQRALGWQLGGSANPDCSSSPFGISDSPVIDRSTSRLYVVDGRNELWGLDLATGSTAPGYPISISPPDATNFEHVWSGLNELNGVIYIPVASECDAGPYRGRLVAVNAATATVSSTFYVNGATATGGGIWGWGGVSFDPSAQHIFLATGNALGSDPNAGHSDAVVKLDTSNLHLSSSNNPGIKGGDTDFGSTPVLFQQGTCPPELAVQSKNGNLYLYDQGRIAQGPLQAIPVSVAKGGSFIGDAAWSSAANLLFVGVSSGLSPYQSGLLAFRLVHSGRTCLLNPAWQAPLGPALSPWPVPPPVAANGVVYIGDGLAQTLTALNASTGAVLWSANLPGQIQTSPIVVNGTLYVADYSGNITAFGLGGTGGTPTNGSAVPVQVPGLSGIAQVSAGGYHSLALASSGAFSAWGSNANGRLGDGTTTDRGSPVSVIGLSPASPPTGGISAGWDHSLALESDGSVWAWGYNGNGQLGNGTTTDSLTPTRVPGLSGITQVSGGYRFSTALGAGGAVWTWGNNTEGELGNGTTTGSSTPGVVPGLSGVTTVSAGYQHVLALRSDGTVWAWGSNYDGQLGNGTNNSSAVPAQVPGLSGITAIAAGGYHSLALRSDGTVWAWGYGTDGQIGNGAAVNALKPIQVPGISGATAVAAGNYHSLAVVQGGAVWAWGYDVDGELGNNARTNSYVPVQAKGLTGVTRIVGGGFHSMAVRSDGTVWTWGSNKYGQLGIGP